MSDIDRSAPIPIYYQLKLLLLRQIEEGELRPGDKIPTEEELCHQYNISRTPVRQALSELNQEGVLVRKVRHGTFVANPEAHTINLRVVVPDRRWCSPLEFAADMWNKNNPKSLIQLEFDTVPLSKLHDRLALLVAQGQAPDISILDSVWIAEFAHHRYLYALAEIQPEWALAMQQGLHPAFLAANSYQGEQYAVPTNVDVSVLWYRRDWLEAEGLAPPQSWQDLINVGLHFRRPEVQTHYELRTSPLVFAGGLAGGETTTYQLLPLFWSTGANIIDGGNVVLHSKATFRTLTFLKDLIYGKAIVSPEVVQLPWDGPLRAFARGHAALAFGGTYENFLIQKHAGWTMQDFLMRVGFVPIPAGPEGSPVSLMGGMTYGIYRQTQHPKEALALLRLALTPSILKSFSLQTGQNVAYIPIAQSIRSEEDEFLKRTVSLFDYARSRPSLATHNRVSEQFARMVEIVLTNQSTVEDAMYDTAERISGITGLPTASTNYV